jgi:hypothetical protein
MSTGISLTQHQRPQSTLNFSAFEEVTPQGAPHARQPIAPGALLFDSGKQKDIHFDTPSNTSQNSLAGSTAQDSATNLLSLLGTLLLAMLNRLLMRPPAAEQSDPSEQAPQRHAVNHNNRGLGTALADNSGPAATPTTSRPGPSADTPTSTQSGAVTVLDHTIKVGPGETFDGHNQIFTASAKLGDGGQREDQLPLFELAEGATLKNLTLGDNEADGIHILAANDKPVTIENLHATNVGEDLLTVKPEGGAEVTHVHIVNSSAAHANDKIFQLNANADLRIDGFTADDFGTFVRTNGGQQFDKMNLDLDNIQARHGKYSFVKSDSENLNLHTHDIRLTDVQHPYDKTRASTHHTGQ